MKPKKENLAERLFVLFGKNMSRIGKKLILIPENIKVELKDGEIFDTNIKGYEMPVTEIGQQEEPVIMTMLDASKKKKK